ncbi:IS110 family transposase [Phytohabitans houttuyneae]|nr:IS110 family transposase [Phytohabitans houttuyneae]
MPSKPEQYPYVVVGVDTHKDVHVAAVLSPLGALLGTMSFPTTRDGYLGLVEWATGFGVVRRAGVEGTGSYGAALARVLRQAGIDVIEINRPDRAARRRRGKTDAVDAEAAARSVLAGQASVIPKTGEGPVEAIRVLKLAKDSAVKARVQAINQIHAVLVNAEAAMREQLSSLSNRRLVEACARLDPAVHDGATAVVVYALTRLAQRIQFLMQEIREVQRRLTAAVKATAPRLLEVSGIGPDCAATLLVAAGDNPHRLASEASFAALCGVSPVEASSGKVQRHRLNRGGHRQANAALFRAVLTRLRWDTRTREYLQRRTTEGLSKREIIRCLKRYLARTVYKVICTAIPNPTTAATT